jgi:hypothetical protein
MRLSIRLGLGALLALATPGCGWEAELAPGNVIDRTRMLGTRFEVVEIGPEWPERVGFDPDGAPITEALPGDLVRLEAMIVDAEAHPIAPESFDAIWLQGYLGLSGLPRCQDIEWTSAVACEIGRGGAVEFEAPPLGPQRNFYEFDQTLRVPTLAIVALDEQITADECLTIYQAPTPEIRRCAIVRGSYVLGPLWPLLAISDAAGVPVDFPITEIPGPALVWPANRSPMPLLEPRFVDANNLEPLEGNPPRVHAGQEVLGQGLWREEDAQVFLEARTVVEGESYVFQPTREAVLADWYVTESLRAAPVGGHTVLLRVILDPEPGPAMLIMVFKDSRESYGLRVFEFEVVP